MTALTKDSGVNSKDTGRSIDNVGLAAGAVVFNGGMVAMNSSGFIVPAGDLPSHALFGLAEQSADNSAGANGDLKVRVRKGTFELKTDGGFALTQSDIGRDVYVLDDATVVKQGGTSNSLVAGVLDSFDIETGRPWVTLWDQAFGSDAEDRTVFSNLVFTDTQPAGGNKYRDWEELLAVANAIAPACGKVEIFFDVGQFDFIEIPAPATPGAVYAVEHLIFHCPQFFGFVDFLSGVRFDGFPEFSSSRIAAWSSFADNAVWDEDDAGFSNSFQSRILVTNRGSNLFQQFTATPMMTIADGDSMSFLTRSGSFDINPIVGEAVLLSGEARLAYSPQGGTANLRADTVRSLAPGDGMIELNGRNLFPQARFAIDQQSNFDGLIRYAPGNWRTAQLEPFPLDGGIVRASGALPHGVHARLDDLTVSASLTYNDDDGSTNSEITGADFSAYKAGDAVKVTGTVSNNGVFTANADGDGTTLQLTGVVLTDEGPVASVATLDDIVLTLPDPTGHPGTMLKVSNFGATNPVGVTSADTIRNDLPSSEVPIAKTGTYDVSSAGIISSVDFAGVPGPKEWVAQLSA